MSAQHTAGSIRYEYEPGYCGELIARDGMTVAAFTDEPSEADARRLVACWNACDGVSTEHLEDDAVRKLIQDRDLLLAQRDELLEAAKQMQAWVLVLLNSLDAELDNFEMELSNSKTGDSVTLSLKEHFVKASAAIAKAGGAT